MNYSFELLAKNPELISMCGDELHPDCIRACEVEADEYFGHCACQDAIRNIRARINTRALITKYRKHHAAP